MTDDAMTRLQALLTEATAHWRATEDRRLAVSAAYPTAEFGPFPAMMTCDGCRSNDTCKYAFDHYNTDGDCLAAK